MTSCSFTVDDVLDYLLYVRGDFLESSLLVWQFHGYKRPYHFQTPHCSHTPLVQQYTQKS